MDTRHIPEKKPPLKHVTGKGYAAVWFALMALTGATVLTASLHAGRAALYICLGISCIQATLVFLFFMNLCFEKSMVIKLVVPIVITLLAIFIGLTFSDVVTR
ncbi:MAG: cytochrome C oxidase subunit IV family protein [Chitinispirillaceae bacterium]|jgi:caa(3)-type oxidase subunit IV